MDHGEDQVAVRAAVVDILVFMSSDDCTDEKLAAIRTKVLEAAAIARGGETRIKRQEANA